MNIENVMYFALGLLIAGLLALMLMPAIWRRAVRLTKKRIEAATPLTMAEFRADKDALRAEFALSTRRLELTIESLRGRLAEQLRDAARHKTEVGAIVGERGTHQTILRDLEGREESARNRVLQLERENTDLAQKLRMRERELAEKLSQFEKQKAESKAKYAARPASIEGVKLTRNYETDIEALAAVIRSERARAEAGGAAVADGATMPLPEGEPAQAGGRDGQAGEIDQGIATASMAEAEAAMAASASRVTALLQETSPVVAEIAAAAPGPGLMQAVSLDADMQAVRAKVLDVEALILKDWGSAGVDEDGLRQKLGDIAEDVGRLVYAIETAEAEAPAEESLLARVQRFAEDGGTSAAVAAQPSAAAAPQGQG
ncbi:hypothetical protein SAMN02983003_1701 [Devosia enhydra]|uniref:Uncharacterized protein n=1 Tax=Devosia enhydra TaxID=665118 RepID=A0A1K2HWP9_9HYPH|nr:hypothetical protein [Devosia enhydra]SFZ83533.1 hypothetical protein SAMN02983003_1701 [Devosia enhydra]